MYGFSDNQRVRGNGNGNRGRGRGRGRSNAINAGNGNFNIGVNGSGTRSNNTGIDGGQIPNVNGTRGYNIYANPNGALYNSNGGNFYGMASHGRGDSRNDTYETSNVYAQYGPVGNFPAHQPEDYGTPVMSSEAQIAAAAARSTTAVQAILAAGPVTVSMATERERMNASVNSPSFLHGFIISTNSRNDWFSVVLPHIRSLTFRIESAADLHHFANVLGSSQLPSLHAAITKIDFPAMHWFSGVAHNRRANPYLEISRSLPALEEMSFRLHTAGITTSRFSERQMIALEATDPEQARERKCMTLQEVVRKYDLSVVFACRSLRRLRVEYIDCERTRYFTRMGDAVGLFREVQVWLVGGFAQHGLNVIVELVRVE